LFLDGKGVSIVHGERLELPVWPRNCRLHHAARSLRCTS
jgi:hypothetical protein